MKYIIFAEKPSQASAYADAFTIKDKKKTYIELNECKTFPEGAFITWGVGHLVSLKMPQEYKKEWATWNLENLPIIPDEFEFKVNNDKKEQFKTVKKLFNDGQIKEGKLKNFCIINSDDIDREGSNIFYSIYHMTGTKNKNIKRLWINSLETEEIKKGFNNLHDNKKDLLMYHEAKTRQIADWLVGINMSQLFSLSLQDKGMNTSLSVGRVQSPLVYMIYQRQNEIKNFKSEPFFELEGQFEHQNGKYKGKSKIKEKDKNKVINLLEKNKVIDMKTSNSFIKDVSKKVKAEKPPKLHSLSSLQTRANKKWKYSPSKVLETIQSLYEKKITSYPRTDCNFITESEFNYLSNNIKKLQELYGVEFQADTTPKKRFVDNKKVEEHFALIPTKKIPDQNILKNLSDEETNIYYEILATTLGMFHKDYEYEETIITTDVNNIEFFTKGKIENRKGWKILFSNENEEKKESSEKSSSNEVLPSVSVNDYVLSHLNITEGKTNPPKPFTEGGLINLMKTSGKYAENEDDSEMLKKVEGIGTEATRSGIIETVKKNDYIKITKNNVDITEKGIILCEAIEGSLLSSPVMTAKWETYLNKIGNGEGNQEHFLENIKNFIKHTIEETPKKLEKMNDKIDNHNKKNSVAKCPSCDGFIEDKGKFYGCSGYQTGCKVSFPKKWSQKNLTKTMIKTLCEDKETKKMKGFISKKNKKFEAKLILDDNYKLKFNFN